MIDYISFQKAHLLIIFFLFNQPLVHSEENQLYPKPDLSKKHKKISFEESNSYIEHGIVVFDYTVVPLSLGGSIDFFGTHYLHQINDWLYFGIGVQAPLIKGNYGGFMAFDLSAHAQYNILDDLYVNAGAAVGGGGGGSSVTQSIELSGTGGFVKSYVGLGYKITENLSLGINYNYFKFKDSQIDNAQLGVFVQTPTSYTTSSYANSGKLVKPAYDVATSNDNMFTFELNNIFQINPTAKNKEIINSITLQYSHFINDNNYLFLELEVGYKGLPIYNQFLHGFGHRSLLSSHINMYSQIGVGSGGYSPNDIDTGPGLLIYPKVSLEYALNENIGVALSGGYLFAPLGTSKNYTFGTAVNYHPSKKQKTNKTSNGFRIDIFSQTQFDVKIDNEKHQNIQLLSIQTSNLINNYWYIAAQMSVAYTSVLGYPGYGEILGGIGIQSRYYKSNKFQNFFQILAGTNVFIPILKPSVGSNYSINEKYAAYLQLGKTISIGNANNENLSYDAYNIGFGITYRFSVK